MQTLLQIQDEAEARFAALSPSLLRTYLALAYTTGKIEGANEASRIVQAVFDKATQPRG